MSPAPKTRKRTLGELFCRRIRSILLDSLAASPPLSKRPRRERNVGDNIQFTGAAARISSKYDTLAFSCPLLTLSTGHRDSSLGTEGDGLLGIGGAEVRTTRTVTGASGMTFPLFFCTLSYTFRSDYQTPPTFTQEQIDAFDRTHISASVIVHIAGKYFRLTREFWDHPIPF